MSEEHPLSKKNNVLIGPNARGKANIIQAFEFLKDVMNPAWPRNPASG